MNLPKKQLNIVFAILLVLGGFLSVRAEEPPYEPANPGVKRLLDVIAADAESLNAGQQFEEMRTSFDRTADHAETILGDCLAFRGDWKAYPHSLVCDHFSRQDRTLESVVTPALLIGKKVKDLSPVFSNVHNDLKNEYLTFSQKVEDYCMKVDSTKKQSHRTAINEFEKSLKVIKNRAFELYKLANSELKSAYIAKMRKAAKKAHSRFSGYAVEAQQAESSAVKSNIGKAPASVPVKKTEKKFAE